jgi:ubiquitin carboxyl-terminal hydrolase 34
MHRSKINDRFEFPTTLDMKPYTIDHLSAKESGVDADMGADEFELVGVLVHTGTAESGHYYSYIRDRLSPAGAPYWYEYNDSEVSPFDPSTIPENCYGGGEPGSATGYMLPKSYSAYMLFYQRSSSLSKLFDGGPNQPNEVPLPLRLHQEILHDNEELLKRYCMFGSNYVDFVKELLDEQSRIPRPDINGCSHELEVLRLGLQTFEQICSKVKEFSGLEGLSMSIERFAVRNQECCRYFLEWLSDDNIISSMVICAPFPAIRATVCKMMINALGCMAGLNTTLYGRHDPDYDGVPITREQTMLFMVCKGVSNSWMGLRMTAKSWNDFFTVLVEICSWGTCEQEYMLKAGILRKVLEMVLIDHLPTPRRAEQSTEQLIKLMSKPKVPVAKMTELLCLLMSRCTPFIKPVKNEAIRDRCSRGTAIMPLTILENDFLRHNPDQASAGLVVYTKLLECIGTVIPLGVMTANILKARCAPDEDFFIYCIKQTLLNGVPVDPASHAAPSLHCLVSFVSATKSQGYIDDIIKKVAEEVPTIGMSGGAEHLQFFRNLCKLDATDRSIKRPVIESIQLWAPALLVYHEAEVREATEDFTDWLFIEEEVSEPIRKKALGELADGCFKFITTKFPQNHQPVDEHTFESLLRILENCKLIDSKLEGMF